MSRDARRRPSPVGFLKPKRTSPYRDRPPLLTPALTVDGVLIEEGKVLLVRRGRPPWKGRWALPGGFVEIGESCEHAVVRECQEETRISVHPIGLVGVYSDPHRDPRGHLVTVAFLVRRLKGGPREARGGDDAADAQWFPVRRPPPLAADHAQILRDARRTHPTTAR